MNPQICLSLRNRSPLDIFELQHKFGTACLEDNMCHLACKFRVRILVNAKTKFVITNSMQYFSNRRNNKLTCLSTTNWKGVSFLRPFIPHSHSQTGTFLCVWRNSRSLFRSASSSSVTASIPRFRAGFMPFFYSRNRYFGFHRSFQITTTSLTFNRQW